MLLDGLLLLLGLALIYYSGEWFVSGSVALAEILNWSKLIIGVVILGFGTSVPEIAVTISSSIEGHGGIAVGSILGSNVANVLLILGVSLTIGACAKHPKISIIYPILLVISALLFIFGLWREYFSQFIGIIMLVITFVSAYAMIRTERKKNHNGERVRHQHNVYWVMCKLLLSLVFLVISANLIVDSVVGISQKFAIPATVIAASIVAIGTSLPELVLSIIAARENHFDLVLGNIIGSNVSNILLGIGLPASLVSVAITRQTHWLEYIVFVLSTILLIALCYLDKLRHRLLGILSILLYIGFIVLLFA